MSEANNTVTVEFMQQRMFWMNRIHTEDKVALLNAFKEKFGNEVIDVLEKVECEKAKLEWENISKQCEDKSIEQLEILLWEPLRAKGFEFTFEKKSDGLQMYCTKCPFHELAKEIGAEDWLFHHTCSVDPFAAAGFNPKIALNRTKTLMQGDECCNHFYYYREETE